MTHIFGRVDRLENLAELILRNTQATIANADFNNIIFSGNRDGDFPLAVGRNTGLFGVG